eukprot:c28686_g1_i1 orf=66-242(+)
MFFAPFFHAFLPIPTVSNHFCILIMPAAASVPATSLLSSCTACPKAHFAPPTSPHFRQ